MTPGRRGHGSITASSARSRSTTVGSAHSGTNTRSRRSAALATTAAPSAALPQLAIARSRGAASPPVDRLDDPQVRHQSHEVPGLVRPRDVAGLVLDPDPARRREAERVGQPSRPAERGDREPVPVDGGYGVVELAEQLDVVLIGQPAREPEVVRVEQLAVAHERVRVGQRIVGRREARRGPDRASEPSRGRRRRAPALRQRNGSGSPGSASAPQAAHATVEAGRAPSARPPATSTRSFTTPPARPCVR